MAESLHILLGTSACLQWLCHSGERTVARGPLVFSLFFFFTFFIQNYAIFIKYIWTQLHDSHKITKSI